MSKKNILLFIVILISVSGLLGYIPSLEILGNIKEEYIPMAPSTALCFLLLGFSLLFNNKKFFLIPTILVSVFGILKLIGSFIEIDFERNFIPDIGTLNGIPIGIMSPATGALFVLFGITIIMIFQNKKLIYFISGLASMTFLISFIFVLAYFYGSPLMYSIGNIPMALTTALGFLFLSIYILTSNEKYFPMSLLVGKTTYSYLLRSILPLTVLPLIIGGILNVSPILLLDINLALLQAIVTIFILVITSIVVAIISSKIGADIDASAKALKQSEALLKLSMESSKDIIMLSIDKDYKYLYFNQVHTDTMSYLYNTVPEIGKSMLELIKNEEDIVSVKLNFEKAFEGESHKTIQEFGEGSGRSYFETKYNPILNEDDEIIGASLFSSNITERKQAEEALKESEATVKNKLKAITEPEGDIGTLELSDILDTDILQEIMEDFYNITGILGAVLDLSGKILVAVGWQDICTKFHRCNPDSLKNCMESDTILTQGVQDGEYKAYHCKNHMWDIVTPLMVGGRHVGNIFMGQYFLEDDVVDVELFREQARKYGYDEKDYLEALKRVPRFSKETINSGMHFFSNLAGIISSLGFSALKQSRLLAEREQAQEALNKSELQLHQSKKMDAVGQLAGGIAHDFNNSLSGILSVTELMLLDSFDIKKKDKMLNMILRSVEKAGELTKKLLMFSGKGRQLSTTINIVNVANETVDILKHTIDKNISLLIEDKSKYSNVIGDGSMIQNVFINLAINSSHVMPDGGEITFTLDNINLDPEYCKNSPFTIDAGDYIEIRVRDTGVGMSLETQSHIFEPFFTTKEQGVGTGLGLSTVYQTVKDHKGAITVYSEVGHGTVFSVYIPLTEQEINDEEQLDICIGSGTILLIDDEDILRETSKAMLTTLGYSVITAENGEVGLNVFKDNNKQIDLIILDMIMPVMGGREAFTKLREIDPNIPIIICSGFTKDGDADDLKKNGADMFIHKPFRLAELSNIVSESLKYINKDN